MGGRGSGSGMRVGVGGAGGGGLGGNAGIASQAPSPQNTPVVQGAVTQLSQMTDDQLSQLVMQSKTVDMPSQLSDVSDATQKFVYLAGLNEKPQVLSDKAFKQYMSDNGLTKSDILSRSVGGANYSVQGTSIRLSPTQVTDMTKYSALNYIGGKVGGQVYGAGTYFDQNGGRNTGYSNGATMIGVLSKNAKPITKSSLIQKSQAWARKNPKSAQAIGRISNSNLSIYALAQGYNVITSGNGYFNVIDRSAVVLRDRNL